MANELMIKAATYQYPEQIPAGVWFLPAVFMKYGDAIRNITAKYQDFLGNGWQIYDPYENMDPKYHQGEYIDEWGCVWSNKVDGMGGLVTGHPIKTRADVYNMKVPDTDTGLPHGCMYLRILDLRGFEEAMVDFCEEPPELQILIDKILQYNISQVQLLLKNNKDKMVFFWDDLGMQHGLAIGPEKWRKYMKPCFAAMYKLCKDDGRLIYMHTDGCIHEIMPDLQECGVDIINPQVRANGLDNLERVCKGKIPINLDLDRQLFPFATPSEIRAHIEECITRLYLPEGGLGVGAEISPDIPLANIEAIIDTLNRMRFYKG